MQTRELGWRSTFWLEHYGQLREKGLPDRELFDAMASRYPSWVSRQQFLRLGSG